MPSISGLTRATKLKLNLCASREEFKQQLKQLESQLETADPLAPINALPPLEKNCPPEMNESEKQILELMKELDSLETPLELPRPSTATEPEQNTQTLYIPHAPTEPLEKRKSGVWIHARLRPIRKTQPYLHDQQSQHAEVKISIASVPPVRLESN